MRIRSTKPEFWRSKRIASVDWGARLVLKALESYVDDNGVGRDDISLIATDTFPRDLIQEPSRVLKQLQTALTDLENAGLLWRYTIDGEKLIYIAFWEQVQYINRPSKGRLPRPDGTLEYGESEIREATTGALKSLQEPSISKQGTGNREQGTRRTSVGRAPYSETFETWWKNYPIKNGKKKAYEAFKKAVKRATVEEITAGTIAYAKHLQASPHVSPKYAEGWLNDDRWTDELTVASVETQRASDRSAEDLHAYW